MSALSPGARIGANAIKYEIVFGSWFTITLIVGMLYLKEFI